MSTKFSIIIPCYNVSAYVRECLDSVLAQSESSWEAICTDDGSTDETGRILEEYAAKDLRIKVIHQTNGGLSAARNAAIKMATGEWLCYLDGDDMLTPWALETYAEMEKTFPQADIMRAGMYTFKDGSFVMPKRGNLDTEGVDLSLEVPVYGIDGYFTQMVYRRALFGDIPFVGMSWCEERPYVAKCLARARFGTNTKTPAYCFRNRGGSITHTKMKLEHQKGYLDATREIMKIHDASGKPLSRGASRMFITNWLEWQPRYIVEHLEKEDRKEAWRYYLDSIYDIKIHQATSWQKFVIITLRILPFHLTAYVLGYLPDMLKRKGIHR